MQVGAHTTACSWIGACNGNKECIGQCPVALGIAYNESKLNPLGQGSDSIGRGLYQIGGPAAYPSTRGFKGPMCVKGPNKLNSTVADCDAFNPMKNTKFAVEMSYGGKNWLPTGAGWWSCRTDTKKLRATTEQGTKFTLNGAKTACDQAAKDMGYMDVNMNATDNCAVGPAKNGIIK